MMSDNPRDVLPCLKEQAVGHFHDIGLVTDGHLAATGLFQVFEAVTRGALGGAAGNALDRLGSASSTIRSLPT